MKIKIYILFIACIISFTCRAGERMRYNTISAGNPILPGYFADPTVKKIGDRYYIYATTDGNGGGLGPSQVWTSKDFVNWTIMPMNWPSTYHIWAPDVMEKDGKYYLYYCQPCKIYCGVSETPRGPWKNILGDDEAVLIEDRYIKTAITLDAQHFIDDDGSVYLYWGTWGIYKGFGCGAGKLSEDLKSFTQLHLIPNTEATDFFEAPFVIKKDGIYYFTYSSGSCHDHTYRVQYATSKESPLGPFTFADNNPILETSADSTIHGPGHHSILQEGDDYYIVYHRHNIPGSTRGMHRQIAVDKLVFTADGQIEKVDAGHEGIGFLQKNTNPYPNLAHGKKVTASSWYNELFKPAYAVDDNNATLWRPATCGEEWIQIDLEKPQSIERIWTQFEYPTSFYQYIIETSLDGKKWYMFSDKSNNTLAGSPMVDFGKAKARYVRLKYTGGQKNGQFGAIWNIKVFGGSREDPPQLWVHLPADTFDEEQKRWRNNNGMLGSALVLRKGDARLTTIAGKKTLELSGGSELHSDFFIPATIGKGDNYTLTYQKLVNDTWETVVVTEGNDDEAVILDTKQRKLIVKADNHPVYIRDLRLYSWQQEPAEIAYDAESNFSVPQAAPSGKKGLILSLSADDYETGSSPRQLNNKGEIQGRYHAEDSCVRIEMKNDKKAFAFNGSQMYRSDFKLPASMCDNAPYTMAGWILNPQADENECAVDLISSDGELEKIMLCYGTNERSGIICHYGWYEDMGLSGFKGKDEWVHIAVTYDGYIEKLYINGQLVKEKDIYLKLPESKYVTLGKNSRGHWPFTGWLHSFEVYDNVMCETEIQKLYE